MSWFDHKSVYFQIEIDYKGECTSGDTIDSLGGELHEDPCPGVGRRCALTSIYSACEPAQPVKVSLQYAGQASKIQAEVW